MDESTGERPVVKRLDAPHRAMIMHIHYDADTTTSGWAVVRTLPSMLECHTGSLPHTTAERVFLSTLLRELFAIPVDAFISVTMLTSFPTLLLHTCRPWVWRTQDWHEDGQPVANADLWALPLPQIDQHCVTCHLLTLNQRNHLDALLANLLACIAAQGGVMRAVGAGSPVGTNGTEMPPMNASHTNRDSTAAE